MWWVILLIVYVTIAIVILLYCMGVMLGIFEAALEEQNKNENTLNE